ncbi:cohesin subunit SA-1-like [Centruroides sculpturatus]|uniref:cohesin subunit SA-1-like n=1 Tax=Centruroides sculpturatus TaxID=218467 RepID=UPI000C6D4865|nr:cohesin subunit SA-1-like [Centruroides sculpturatus]
MKKYCSDDDPGDVSYEEPTTRGRKRRKVDGPKQTRSKKGRETTRRGKVGQRAVSDSTSDDPNSLFEIVKQGKSSLQSVVDDWIEAYKQDRDTALLDLMQFFIQCAGCKGRITPNMQASMEHAQIIRKMTEEFDEESGDYPLIMTGPQWKKFRSNFCEFVQVLVRQCQYSIIYDQYLMDNVISLLTGLSDSQVRAFRHTATLAAMKLMTALVDVALNLSINLDNTQRQYEAERQKNRDKRATERLEMLMSKRQELEENMEEIKNMLTYMFKSVFVHRYRDTLPEIRSICMYEIGQWMKKFHQHFLDDSYLKYIGWTLHDKVGDVRLKCLQALLPLYASEELTSKLELFTNKFKDRIVAMTLDKEYEVAVHAVKLVISIHKIFWVICPKKWFTNINSLVSISILHEHGAYLVDSLIESNPMMKDWECMTDLLLEEPGSQEEPLDDRQETSLIEIMVCCVKQAATGEPPVGRGPNRKQLSAKELKQVGDDRVKLTEHFILTLPQLLAKYMADQEKIANLMVIPQYFDLEIYTTSRQEKNLDNLLKLIHDIVERHNDTEVLEACAKTYEALCNEELAIHSRCAVARGTLIDSLIHKYKQALSDLIQAIYSCHNLGPWGIWDGIFEFWVKGSVQGEKLLSEELGLHILHNFFYVVFLKAFVTICDLLIVFCKQLADNAALIPLVYEPDRSLQNQLGAFIQDKVFVEDDDDEQDEHMKIEELHKRRNFLASFCKLVVYNIISIKQASDVFKHYVKFYNDYGDIIKATLGKAREINKVNCARTMAVSLTTLFTELRTEQNTGLINRQDENFTAIKELAKRFALSFGLDQVKNRDSVAALHREGILFAVTPFENVVDPLGPPPNLAFLEILCEFTNKLMKQDKKVVLTYLDRHIQTSMPGTRMDDWQPLVTYRNSLVHGEAEQPPPRAPGRQYRGKKRQREDGKLMEAVQWENFPYIQEGRPQEEENNIDADSDHGSED